MLKTNKTVPEAETSPSYSVVTSSREVRSRFTMGLRSLLQPGEWAHRASDAVGGYVHFVRTTLSSSSSSPPSSTNATTSTSTRT